MGDVARVAARYDCTLEQGGGKHNWRFKKAGKRTYPVPAKGLNTEISWKYIQGLCHNMDIPVEAFAD